MKPALARRPEMASLKTVISFGSAEGDVEYEALLRSGTPTHTSADPADTEIAVLHYTSGSSGVLKAAMQSWRARKALVRKLATIPLARIETTDIMAHVGPVSHASGKFMMGVFRVGGCNLMMSRFDVDELMQTVEDEKVTRLLLVPTMVNRIVNHPGIDKYDLSSLRSVAYGAAPMAPALVEKAMGLFGPILGQGYGLGESTGIVTILTEQDHVDALNGDRKRLASCGRCYFETDLQVVGEDGAPVRPGEIGEIIIRGPDVMSGYFGAPELIKATMRGEAYMTGDLAVVDDEGYVFIVDRKKEMIISGGFNVYPSEVERVLYHHDAVFETVVVGAPHEEWGEAIKAVVVAKPGTAPSEADILEYCREKLPGFKRPRSVDFVDELPKNPNGKVVRRQVRDAYWKDSGRKV